MNLSGSIFWKHTILDSKSEKSLNKSGYTRSLKGLLLHKNLRKIAVLSPENFNQFDLPPSQNLLLLAVWEVSSIKISAHHVPGVLIVKIGHMIFGH